MKRQMQFLSLLLVGLCLNAFSGMAQERSYQGSISVEPVRLEQHGEVLHIDMNIILKDLTVNSPQGIDIIPQLVSLTSTQLSSLPKVSIKGRNEFLAYERKMSLMNKKERAAHQAPYEIVKAFSKQNKTIHYKYMLPYEEWMADAKLEIKRDECGCGDTNLMLVEEVIGRVTMDPKNAISYIITPHMAYVQPEVEDIKRREIQAECFLDFVVNKTDIRPEYMNNPRELAKIYAMINDLKSDPSIKINRLDIIGYASPEGTLEGNRRLSEGRARALRNYLASQYEFPKNIYRIEFGGENWSGLIKALPRAEVDYKDEILNIIENTSNQERRKMKLMQLRGGNPYRYLLKNVYPSLRVAICRVEYDIKNFNLDEAKEVIKQRPQNLSLNEMFMVANTYPQGSQEFIDVFETAVRMFPENEVAILNAATSAIQRNDLVSAERYLKRVNPANYPAEYNNTMGMLTLLKGEYDVAEKHLKAATELGLEAASQNMEELTNKKNSIKRANKK